MMKNDVLDVLVIGAGHAGLSASYYLTQKGLKHLVLERDRVGASWRTQRWDSFVMNTGYACHQLSGNEDLPRKNEFVTAGEFVQALDAYVRKFQLPVIEQATVLAVEKPAGEEVFIVTVAESGLTNKYKARQVIISSGSQNRKVLPAFAANVPAHVLQLHAGEYRNAAVLPAGAVLVAGSAQSGCQVAADIAASGKKVWLSTSMVGRVPRRYRGRDIMDWLHTIGFFDVKKSAVTEPGMLHIKPPQLTGTSGGKYSISLQWLAKKGVEIVGKTSNINDDTIFFKQDAAANVQFADGFSAMVKTKIDNFIAATAVFAPAPEIDTADIPDPQAACVSPVSSLHINNDQVGTIIWATGFSADFSYIKLPVLDEEGNPEHLDGIAATKGLYFLGLPWLRSMKSALINGTKADAAFIVEKLVACAKESWAGPVYH